MQSNYGTHWNIERIVKGVVRKEGVVQKEGNVYLLHEKCKQGRINVLVDCLGEKLRDQLQEKCLHELYYEVPRRPRRRLGIYNRSLKSYVDALIARFGNLQDNDDVTTNDEHDRIDGNEKLRMQTN